MKKNFLLVAFMLFLGAIFYQCTRKNAPSTTDNITPEQYPNDSSELAILMREMDKDFQNLKILLGKKDEKKDVQIPDLREKFAKIHTATPTEADKKDATYKAMSDVFLKNLDTFYAEPQNRLDNYTILVNACLNCHKSLCPGPTVRIKKLHF